MIHRKNEQPKDCYSFQQDDPDSKQNILERPVKYINSKETMSVNLSFCISDAANIFRLHSHPHDICPTQLDKSLEVRGLLRKWGK